MEDVVVSELNIGGSPGSVEQLHREFGGWLTGYARMLDAGHGDDAAQDAFAAYAKRSQRPPPVENPQAYLVTCVKNSIAKANRLPQRLWNRTPIQWDSYTDPDLIGALCSLAPAQQECLALRYGRDLTISEIAGLLDVSESTVRTHIDRGLSGLRRKLGPQP